jgi:hypothetical protein
MDPTNVTVCMLVQKSQPSSRKDGKLKNGRITNGTPKRREKSGRRKILSRLLEMVDGKSNVHQYSGICRQGEGNVHEETLKL